MGPPPIIKNTYSINDKSNLRRTLSLYEIENVYCCNGWTNVLSGVWTFLEKLIHVQFVTLSPFITFCIKSYHDTWTICKNLNKVKKNLEKWLSNWNLKLHNAYHILSLKYITMINLVKVKVYIKLSTPHGNCRHNACI